MGISVKRGKDYKPIETDYYDAVLDEVEKRPGKDGKPPWLSWRFKIVNDEEFDDRTVFAASGMDATRGNRLGQILKALAGIEIADEDNDGNDYDEGEEIIDDVSELIGKPCRIFVEQKKKDGKNIYDVKHINKRKSKGGSKKRQEEPEDDDDEVEEEEAPKKSKKSSSKKTTSKKSSGKKGGGKAMRYEDLEDDDDDEDEDDD